MRLLILIGACILGTVAHFLYEPLGRPRALAMFLPVNESPWEHVKLVFWPILLSIGLLAALESCTWAAAAEAALIAAAHGAGVMFGIHYFYRFALEVGEPVLWADIATFFVAMGSAYAAGLRMLARQPSGLEGVASCVVLVSVACFFDSASFVPPRIHLFRDERK